MTDRGLSCRVRPTYVGTRKYTTADGQVITVLRRASQVNSPGHLETMKRVVGTRRHPSRDGRRVFLSATAEPGSPAPWDPSVELWPHQDYFAGTVGDAIKLVDVPGMGLVPEVETTICDRDTLRDVRDGALQVSFGYVSCFVPAAEVPIDDEVIEVGKWKNPATGNVEPFDVEGLVDPTDPRVPEDMREFLGGNHLAYALGTNGTAGRGGPEVRLLLDALEAASNAGLPAARLMVLRRKVDESGNSGTGLVALVLASQTDDGPACALWTTATPSAAAYDSLAAMRAIHVDMHGDGANELAPLAMGWPAPAENEQPAPAAGEDKMADLIPPPQGDKPKPPEGDLAAQLKMKSDAYDELLVKYNALMTEHEALKARMQAESDAKSQAVATADALREQLAPLAKRALDDRRARDLALLGAKGELADKIGKATVDELPGVVVGAHYAARPELAAAVDGLEAKLKDAAWTRHRYELLHEQGAPVAAAGVSDSFRSSFNPGTPPGAPADKPKTMQQRLDDEQRKAGA